MMSGNGQSSSASSARVSARESVNLPRVSVPVDSSKSRVCSYSRRARQRASWSSVCTVLVSGNRRPDFNTVQDLPQVCGMSSHTVGAVLMGAPVVFGRLREPMDFVNNVGLVARVHGGHATTWARSRLAAHGNGRRAAIAAVSIICPALSICELQEGSARRLCRGCVRAMAPACGIAPHQPDSSAPAAHRRACARPAAGLRPAYDRRRSLHPHDHVPRRPLPTPPIGRRDDPRVRFPGTCAAARGGAGGGAMPCPRLPAPSAEGRR